MASERKTQRVRIDAITNGIKRGEYDDKLAEIQEAVRARQEIKRKELLALVQEVYGPDATISTTKTRSLTPANTGGVDLVSASRLGADSSGAVEAVVDPLADADAPPSVDTPGGGDYESRSPLIGPVQPS